MFKKVHIQLISILLLLFVSSNIVATSVDVFAKSKNNWTELRDSEELDEVDDFEENSEENDLLDIHFPDFFASIPEIYAVVSNTDICVSKSSKFTWKTHKRAPKTPIFIQNKQLKISC